METQKTFKEFSLQDFKQDATVVTRNGQQARVICTDRKKIKPIMALIGKKEKLKYFYPNGKYSTNCNTKYDLFIME